MSRKLYGSVLAQLHNLLGQHMKGVGSSLPANESDKLAGLWMIHFSLYEAVGEKITGGRGGNVSVSCATIRYAINVIDKGPMRQNTLLYTFIRRHSLTLLQFIEYMLKLHTINTIYRQNLVPFKLISKRQISSCKMHWLERHVLKTIVNEGGFIIGARSENRLKLFRTWFFSIWMTKMLDFAPV